METPPPMDFSQAPTPPQKKSNTTLIVLVVICIGGLCLCMLAIPALLFPAFGGAKEAAKRSLAMSNVKQVGVGVLIYSSDYDDKLPIADVWMDASFQFVRKKELFHSPGVNDLNAFGLAMRKDLSAQSLTKMVAPEKEPLIFDSTLTQWNANGGLDTLPMPGRYRSGSKSVNVVGYADSRAKFVPDDKDPRMP